MTKESMQFGFLQLTDQEKNIIKKVLECTTNEELAEILNPMDGLEMLELNNYFMIEEVVDNAYDLADGEKGSLTKFVSLNGKMNLIQSIAINKIKMEMLKLAK